MFIQISAASLSLPASVWYLLTCLQGPLQSLPYVQRLTHFTNWVIAHAHMGVLRLFRH